MTDGSEEEMNIDLQEGQYAKTVNTAVSFNAIKNMAFELFMNKDNAATALEKMLQLFKMNPGLERIGREAPPRKKHQICNPLTIKKEPKNMYFNHFFLNLMAVTSGERGLISARANLIPQEHLFFSIKIIIFLEKIKANWKHFVRDDGHLKINQLYQKIVGE